MDDIEDRLRSHAQAFDGLLSLIPAKYYYGEDNTSDQWKRKKQTKEQAREAKRAKLGPESAKTAKDVMDENARKRKREDGSLESDSSDSEELGSELPGEGLTRGEKAKKQKQTEKSDAASKAKADDAEARKKLKEEKKTQKKAAQKEKKKAKESARKEKLQQTENTSSTAAEKSTPKTEQAAEEPTVSDNEDGDDLEGGVPEEGFSLEFNEEPEAPSSASSTRNSPDASNPQSGSSSISSIVPPSTATDAKSVDPKALKATPEELKQRLQKRLDELRAKRHADGFNGKPARNRQELIDSRRQKAEQRKEHKKELRQKAKEEEQRQKDEAMARRFSPGGSGSLLASPRSPAESVGSSSNNFSFGHVMFADGQLADASLSSVRDHSKTRGPKDKDSAAHLKAAEAKKARLAEMDPEKRAELEEKDAWLNAKKRAHGERVRDDTSLLKKALKRKETAKKRSERDWKERIDTVSRMKEQRQTKREENLRKRRDEKGTKGKGKKPSGGGKKKARPGFEGSFKAKVGGKKK
ncbi:uncharacterized protein N7458_007916 [Penicillium daleae]|uniref:Ribosomal RNA-processing protein 14/surfeit locus protein 6 C-terminal domain-containing protein n=1 Tax=Penicillium daleae TaxID=63821 RepID=A0AAD6C2T0_9EURO|nr:uncharacterized protein N7458_007916 [Penicillium daleae]KAJ5444044.1 hypothetical protein N7458_007916 [Penicillium daleae]